MPHTPLPWKILSSKKPRHREARFIKGANGKFVGKTYGHDGEPAQENAELILHCVSAYPKLLEAVRHYITDGQDQAAYLKLVRAYEAATAAADTAELPSAPRVGLSAFQLIASNKERCDLFSMSYDLGDAWGSVMQHWFAIAEVLHHKDEDIPESWKYKRESKADVLVEWPDAEYLEMFEAGTITADDLRHDGNLFEQYAAALKGAGLDY